MNRILNKHMTSMTRLKIVVVLWVLALAPFFHGTPSCSAQSLEFFINKALENNYQIQVTKNEAIIASTNNALGNTGILPTLDVDAQVSRSMKNTNLEFSDGSVREGDNAKNSNINVAAMANWTVFDGFSVLAKREQLANLDAIGELNARFYIEQTVSDIAIAYYQLMYENGILENYGQTLGISAYRLNLEKKKKQMGSGRAIDYGQALVDYQSDSILFLTQRNKIKTLEIELNQLINNSNKNLEQSVDIADSLPGDLFLFPDKGSLLAQIESNSKQLEKERLNELVAETEIRMARSEVYPEINLFGGYQYSKTFAEVGFINSNLNSGPVIGARIRFNLFNAGNAHRDIKNSMVYAKNAKLTREQVQLNLSADALKLYHQYLSVGERLSLALGNVQAIEKVYGIAAEQLSQGAIDGYNFRLIQMTLLNAERTLMQLQLTLKTTEINLNRVSGNVLPVYLK